MNSNFKFFLLLAVVFMLLFGSCRKESGDELLADTGYTFFIAGHTYGQPGVDNKGLHPPFSAKFDLINSRKSKLGILLGDIVFHSTSKDWDEVDSVLQILECPVYFTPGNHDIYPRELYEARYGNTYYSFIIEKDLFILLDPNIDQWRITGEQLQFLTNEIILNGKAARNIFIFHHQLIWWDKQTKYGTVRLNSLEGKADTLNFWTELEPVLRSAEKPVFMFAGDLGAGSWSDDLMFDNYANITLVGTGMGEGVGDNFIFIHVDRDDMIDFELISLNTDDIHGMGALEDYILPGF